MKIKIIVACVAAALVITFISCDWFKSKPTSQAFNLEGKWIVDSVENKDSSKDVGNLILALASKDSLPVGIQFNKDSTFQYLNVQDSAKGKYYVSADASSLFLKEDSVTHQFNFIEKSDSAISFASVDSTKYYLKRK
jgi:hypothetical protein